MLQIGIQQAWLEILFPVLSNCSLRVMYGVRQIHFYCKMTKDNPPANQHRVKDRLNSGSMGPPLPSAFAMSTSNFALIMPSNF
jgi:hypothetical protein